MTTQSPDPADGAYSMDLARRLASAHPLPARLDPAEWSDIVDQAQPLTVDARTLLMSQGAACEAFLLLLDGQVRVYQLGEDGREITIYRIFPGDVCVMSLASLIHCRPFKAFARAETPVQALALRAPVFRRALAVSETFRDWVLSSLTNSFCDMVETFHGTVFNRLEMRLACLLGQHFERVRGDALEITHQEIAQELGTTREVVSRSLKRLEKQGCISLSRGRIAIAPGQKLPTEVS